MTKRIMFHGQECPHCKVMMPLVDRLEKETGISIERLEVWHNEKNADLMRSYKDVITAKCGGQLRTPTFLNKETKDIICGEIEYKKLQEWASK
ncbi:thioredoxin family protein [Acidobacteriota bacterium]